MEIVPLIDDRQGQSGDTQTNKLVQDRQYGVEITRYEDQTLHK